jgi:hypothetical protein
LRSCHGLDGAVVVPRSVLVSDEWLDGVEVMVGW